MNSEPHVKKLEAGGSETNASVCFYSYGWIHIWLWHSKYGRTTILSLKNFFIVVQVHLSPFSPYHSLLPQPSPPPTLNPTHLWLCPCVLYSHSLTTLPPFPPIILSHFPSGYSLLCEISNIYKVNRIVNSHVPITQLQSLTLSCPLAAYIPLRILNPLLKDF